MVDSDRVLSLALDLGFDVAGVAPAQPVPTMDAYVDWLSHEYHGCMHYLARKDRIERRLDPTLILPGARSIICLGLNYCQPPPPDIPRLDGSRGRISRYAWGADYHEVLLGRIEDLARRIASIAGAGASFRCYVDTGPVLERAYAQRAGLGFVGKNACLISPRHGSWLFLGEIVTDLELAPTGTDPRGGCGTCTKCIDACPTGAIVAPYVVDARRCISYLTIEMRGGIPADHRPLVGDRVFGCDVCQDVCPWQRFARPTKESAFQPAGVHQVAPALTDLVRMSARSFGALYGASPISRTKRDGLVRNAIVALGNWGDARARGPLRRALEDVDATVRAHARWALDRLEPDPESGLLSSASKRDEPV
jgi:epoxyqueuosine reductase